MRKHAGKWPERREMTIETQNIVILDCTLRDGSYLIDYQFTAEDTYVICLGLRAAGFKQIEIGHGTGLGSSEAGKGQAAAIDEEYLKAAALALKESDSKFGMFFIPGIGRMKDLQMAAENGMGFVRIGTNIDEIEEAEAYIKEAKSLGMSVSANLMKSYAVSMDKFLSFAKKADEFGADVITVVDSAGGMFPNDVREYVLRLKEVTNRDIGFHGHNNLQLAVANTLEAVRCGASVIDSSLQGMGRSAGNAQTEVLVMILEKLGYRTEVDPFKTMDLGERIIRSMMNREQGVDDISLVSGIAQFHSSFWHIINNAARKYHVDPRQLILEVSKIDRINVSQKLAEKTAKQINSEMQKRPQRRSEIAIGKDLIRREEGGSTLDRARLLADEMVSQSKKTGKEAVFSMTISNTGSSHFPYVRESASLVIGNVETSSLDEMAHLVKILDGHVGWILLDESRRDIRESKIAEKISGSAFAWYSEDRVLRLSTCALLSQRRPKGSVLIMSNRENADLMGLSLNQQGIEVNVWANLQEDFRKFQKTGSKGDSDWGGKISEIGAVVSFGAEYAVDLSVDLIPFFPNEMVIYAARPNAFPKSFWKAVIAKGQSVCRIDSRAALAAELTLVIETKKLIDKMGTLTVAGVTIVAGGIIGRKGDVVVDSVEKPHRVIGVADGYGGLLDAREESPYLGAKEKVRGKLLKDLYESEY